MVVGALQGKGQSRQNVIRRLIAMTQAVTTTDSDEAVISGRYVRLPQWVAAGLITALVASVWGASALSSRVTSLEAGLTVEHNATETYRLEVQALRKDVAYLTGLTVGKNQSGKGE